MKIASAAVIGVLIVGWFVVRPIVVKSIVQSRLSVALGTRVEILAADYSFGSTATLTGLRVYHPTSGEVIAEIDQVEVQFEKSPLSTPKHIVAAFAQNVRLHAVREQDGRWNFEAIKPKPSDDGPMRVDLIRAWGVSADVSRRGGAERFIIELGAAVATPAEATLSSLQVDWSEGGKLDPLARVPTTRVTIKGGVVDDVVVERPEIWAGLTPHGGPELPERLRRILGPSSKSKVERVLVKCVRVEGGTVYGVMNAPDGPEWTLPIESVEGRIDWVEPAVLDLSRLEGRLCGGAFGALGTLRLDDGDSRLQGSLDKVDMEKLAATTRFSKCRVSGSLTAHLDATIKPDGDVIGRGLARARDAHVWELPVFESILSGLGVEVPRDSKFDLMQADIELSGDRFVFRDLKTEGGDTLDVRGEGRMMFDGTGLEVHFWPRPINSDDVPILGQLSELFGGAAATVEVTNTIVDPKVKVVEGVVDLFP